MQKIYNAIIVGGGATGLLCAVELCRGENAFLGQDVLIIERNDRVGKKILATGNGQGNLSNVNLSVDYYHGDRKFIESFFSDLKNNEIEEYFNNLGLPLITDDSGKMFPMSKQASSLSDIIRAHLNNYNVQTVFSEKVVSVGRYKQCFKVQSENQTFYAKNVILACGGKASKQFGTDGSSYGLAQSFGHKLSRLYPALVQIKTEMTHIKGLNGIKEYATVRAYDADKYLASASGDVLFTQYGLSGSTVFSISGYLTTAKKPNVRIEFLPRYSLEQTEEFIKLAKNSPLYRINPLLGIVNKKVGEAIIKRASDRSIPSLARQLKDFRLQVVGDLGFDNAQVTKGGIMTDEINFKTLESNIQKGLYIGGEMLDVDGDCGGYNLTFAFYCGIKIARALKSKNN